jgi:hypothetical protein
MKTSQLRQIIKEEIQKILKEEKEYEIDIYSAEDITLNGEELDSDKIESNSKYRKMIMDQPDKAFIYKGKPATIFGIDLADGYEVDEPKIYLTTY